MRIEARYSGFPDHALGGYVAGLLAGALDTAGTVEVRLERPVLIGDDVRVDAASLMRGDERVASARPITLCMQPPRTVGRDDVERASSSYLGATHHFFPDCFCCGPSRRVGDGLRIFPASLGEVVAAIWRPADAVDGSSVPTEILWSALDCPGIWAHVLATTGSADRAVTGSIAVEQLVPIAPSATLVVTGWPVGRDGRKIHVGAAVADERGTVLAIARQTLIATSAGVPLDRSAWEAAPRPPS